MKRIKCKKPLDFEIGKKLNFNNHIYEIFNKSRTEIKCTVKGLSWAVVNLQKWSMLLNVFFSSHYSYCPLV